MLVSVNLGQNALLMTGEPTGQGSNEFQTYVKVKRAASMWSHVHLSLGFGNSLHSTCLISKLAGRYPRLTSSLKGTGIWVEYRS